MRARRLHFVLTLTFLLAGPAPGSAVVSQGDAALKANLARSTFGVNGAGVKVGVISTGLKGLDAAKNAGELPAGTCGAQSGGVTPLPSATCMVKGAISITGDPEGTALLEIIHDLAPGAQLFFCVPGTSLDMVACYNALTPLVDVIVDDLGFFEEPYFEDGPVALAAASAANSVVVVSAAGNDADHLHYQALYVDNGDANHAHRVAAGDTVITVFSDDFFQTDVFLQWDNKFGQAADDYALCFASDTPADCAPFNNPQTGSQDPIENFFIPGSSENDSCFFGCPMQIRKISGSPRTLELFALSGFFGDPPDSSAGDSIFGHPAVVSVLAVGAVAFDDPGLDTVELFSSRGPSTIAFPSAVKRKKPDVVAVDRVAVSGAGGFPTEFFGTSAAAPHVAAIAALILDANPGLMPAQVRSLIQRTAVPLANTIPNSTSGFGRVDAQAAVKGALTDLRVTSFTAPTSGIIGGSISVTDTVKNTGTQPAGASTTRYYLSLNNTFGNTDILLTGTRAVPQLASLAISKGTVSAGVPASTAPGNYFVLACADDLKVVLEGNESNCRASTETVALATGPDLRVVSVANVPAAAVAGTSFAIQVRTVNEGLAASAVTSRTNVFLSLDTRKDSGDTVIGGVNISALQPGTGVTKTITVTIPLDAVPGAYRLIGCADTARVVAESDETDNCQASSTKVTVSAP